MNGSRVAALAACTTQVGRYDVFIRAVDGEVWQKSFDATTPTWRSHGRPSAGQRLTVSASASGHIDVFAPDFDSEVLWHKSIDGQASTEWARQDPMSVEDGRGAASGDFRVGPDSTLLIQASGSTDWEDLGGYITGGDAHVAIVRSADRVAAFAVWADTTVMRREYVGEWSVWEIVDVLDVPTDSLSVLRANDLVSLTVRARGLRTRQGAAGLPEWVAEGAEGRLIVDFPPQHIAETVLTTGTSSQSRLAGPSSLHFVVTTQAITLTVDGVLRAMSVLPMAVTPRAQGQASALELPWRLLLALQERARCKHRVRPATSTAGSTEMWHTRILGPGDGYAAVHPFGSLALDTAFADQTPLARRVTDIGKAGELNPATPVTTDRLVLSACGAWFSGNGSWPQLDWTHRLAMARDYYVRVLVRGVLFPFGHKASIVETVERQFDTAAPALAALRKIRMLVLTEPSRTYGVSAPHERAFPFQRIDIEPRLVTPIDPADPPNAYWPKRDGQPVMFSVRGWAGGEVIEMQLPLLFSEGTASAAELDRIFAQGVNGVDDPSQRPTATVGRFMPLAMKDAQHALAGAEQQVHSLTFGGAALGAGGEFHPKITELRVDLPAVNQILGPGPPVVATLSSELIAAPAGGEPKVLLDFAARELNFAATGAGAIAAPSMNVSQISRELGPMVALPPNPKPEDLFPAGAKLLGIIPLRDVIPAITGAPEITWDDGPPPGAKMHWEEKLEKTLGPFMPGPGKCKVVLDVQTTMGPDGKPKMTTCGTVSSFQLKIPTPELTFIELAFAHVTFEVETGGRPTVTFKIAKAGLGKELNFVKKFQPFLEQVGNSGPTIEIALTEIKVGFRIAIPTPLGMGVFTLQNLALQAGITLSLADQPLTIDFSFGTRDAPFLVTVMAFGGGGYLELGIAAGGDGGGLVRFVGGIEFGASIAMNFGVASGEVHVFGGIVFVKQPRGIEITGYLRIGGMVEVLGLISVSVELTLSLTYFVTENKLRGEAKLVITVDLTLWSTTVELKCYKEFAGPSLLAADPDALPVAPVGSTVLESLGPIGSDFPWHTYCRAFVA